MKQLLTQTSVPGHSRALNWSKLVVGSPERCPVCVKHIASHGGVLIANIYKQALLKYAPKNIIRFEANILAIYTSILHQISAIIFNKSI